MTEDRALCNRRGVETLVEGTVHQFRAAGHQFRCRAVRLEEMATLVWFVSIDDAAAAPIVFARPGDLEDIACFEHRVVKAVGLATP